MVLNDTGRNKRGLSEAQKEQLRKFDEVSILNEVNDKTREGKVKAISEWMVWSETPLLKPTSPEIRDYLLCLRRRKTRLGNPLSFGMFRFNKCIIHSYLNFVYDEEIPKKINKIFSQKNKGKKYRDERTRIRFNAEDVATESEILKIIRTAVTPAEKALIAFQYGAGSRPGIVLEMKRHHIRFVGQFGIEYTFPSPERVTLEGGGKTSDGGRAYKKYNWSKGVRFIKAYLEQYDANPHPDGWVWLNRQRRKFKYSMYWKRLREYFKACGINKPSHPHSLRHDRVTHLRGKVPDIHIKEMCSWSKGSNMIERYSHLDSSDYNQAMDEYMGNEKKESDEELFCPHCHFKIYEDQTTCSNCLRNLKYDEDEEKERIKEELRAEMSHEFERKIEEAKLKSADMMGQMMGQMITQQLNDWKEDIIEKTKKMEGGSIEDRLEVLAEILGFPLPKNTNDMVLMKVVEK